MFSDGDLNTNRRSAYREAYTLSPRMLSPVGFPCLAIPLELNSRRQRRVEGLIGICIFRITAVIIFHRIEADLNRRVPLAYPSDVSQGVQ